MSNKVYDQQWEARFQELVDYKRLNGNCNVPQHYKANPPLGTWIFTQRRLGKSTIREERRKRLSSIGFTWIGEAHIIVDWEARFQELVEYKLVHGNCNVPKEYKVNPQLWMWVHRQRSTRETISEERRKKLDSISFTWKAREAHIIVDWKVGFQQLVEYKRVHGNCNVPRACKANPQLGLWVNKQRLRKETMTEERKKRLNCIGFTWKVREAYIIVSWEVRFEQLVEYKRVYGNCNVPQRYKANKQLGEWVGTQRKSTSMSEERRKRLNSIGFTWKNREANADWEVRFQQLVDYNRVHGNCNVPQKYQENPPLGIWVREQRTRFNNATMSKERRKKMNSIGFVWSLKHQPKRASKSTVKEPKKKKARLNEEAAQEDTAFGQQIWDSYFEQLGDFVRKYKHCNVPGSQYPELGRWIEEQRQLYKRKQIGLGMESNLTDEQEAKLMAAGFDFVRSLNIPDDDDIYSI